MLSDLRFAFRQFARAPGFFLVAILTLALGIGACTAIFSVVDGVIIRPLPYPSPDCLMVLRERQLPQFPEFSVSPPDFHDWEQQLHSFSALGATKGAPFNLTGDGEPQRLFGVQVSQGYFDVYGVRPMLGRAFLPEEAVTGRNQVVVLSYACWQRVAGGEPDIIGKKLQLNGLPYEVVGVMPQGFYQSPDIDVWSPLAFTAQELANASRDNHYLRVTGRLAPGVTAAQADAEVRTVEQGIAQRFPDTSKGWSAFAVPMLDYLTKYVRLVLYILLGAVACVLLIACANVANLLLARATARQRELSIRAAVGAGRARLIRQLLTESVLLSLIGGLAGILLARIGLHALLSLAAANLPRSTNVHLDLRVLGAALGLSAATGIAFGLAPAWFASRTALSDAMKKGVPRGRLRGALVIVEVAAALVLLASAALLARSFGRLAHVDPGFRPENAAIVRLTVPDGKYGQNDQKIAFADALERRLAALPGVEAVGMSHVLPLLNDWVISFSIEGRPPLPVSQQPALNYYAATPGYFPAMGIRLIRGRLFDAHDNRQGPPVVIVNEAFVRAHFPTENALGHRINFGNEAKDWREIVGIVADVSQYGVDQATPAQGYIPFNQNPYSSMNFVVRTSGPPGAILTLLRPAVYAVDPSQPVGSVSPLETLVLDSIARQRFAARLLLIFSLAAILIAAVGIYGVMAYTVAQRTGEIGIRLALGAPRSHIFGLILGQGGRLIAAGCACGLIATLFAGKALEASLYQTSAHDPAVLAEIVALFAAVALAACYVPARRAARVDPLQAIRTE